MSTLSRFCLMTLTALSGLLVAAAVSPPGEDSSPIVTCYFAKSIVYGVLRCDPPSSLVGAVFGACYKEEDKIREEIREKYSNELYQRQVADVAIRTIHERMGPRIQNWILDAQISDNPACRPAK